MKRFKKIISGLFNGLSLFLFSGCDEKTSRDIREAIGKGIKEGFAKTWWLWLIICIVIGFIGVMTFIAKKKAQIKIAKKINEKLFKKKK